MGVSWRIVALVALGAFAVFAYSYSVSPHRPGSTSEDGYFGWADQTNYRLEARALRDGVLPGIDYDYERRVPKPGYDPTERPLYDYSYGLGYPALAVPAILVSIDEDPFLPVDAVAFSAIACMIVVLGARLRSVPFGVLAATATTFATPLLDFTVVPWNTTVTTVAILAALLVATDQRARPVVHAVALGLAVGVTFAARYGDFVAPAIIGAVGLLGRQRYRSPAAWRTLGGAALISLAIAIPVLWSHDAVFGSPFTTPYEYHLREDGTSDQTFSSFDVGRAPRSFVEVFVTGRYEGTRVPGEPMLAEFPWLVLAPVGLILALRDRAHDRIIYAVAAALSVASSVMYLSFRAGTGWDLQFHNLRYFVPWVPLWALLGTYAAARGVGLLTGRPRGREPGARDAVSNSGGSEAVATIEVR